MIFHSYVSLPEGIADNLNTDGLTSHGDPNHPTVFLLGPMGKKTHLNVAEKMMDTSNIWAT